MSDDHPAELAAYILLKEHTADGPILLVDAPDLVRSFVETWNVEGLVIVETTGKITGDKKHLATVQAIPGALPASSDAFKSVVFGRPVLDLPTRDQNELLAEARRACRQDGLFLLLLGPMDRLVGSLKWQLKSLWSKHFVDSTIIVQSAFPGQSLVPMDQSEFRPGYLVIDQTDRSKESLGWALLSAGPPLESILAAVNLVALPAHDDENETEHLRESVSLLRKKIERLKQNNQAAEAEILLLAGRLAKMNRLERAVTEQISHSQSLEQDLERRDRHMADLKDQAARLEEQKNGLAESLAEAKTSLAEQSRQRHQMESEIAQLSRQAGTYRDRAEALGKELEDTRQALGDHRSRSTDTERALYELATERDSALSEQNRLLEALRELQKEHESIEARYDQVRQQTEERKRSLAAALDKIENLVAENARRGQETSSFRLQVRDLTTQLEALKAELASGISRQQELTAEREKLSSQINRLEADLRRSKDELIEAASIREQRDKLNGQAEELKGLLADHKRQIHDLKVLVDRLQQERDRLSHDLDEQTQRNMHLEQVVSSSRRELKSRAKELADLQDRIDDLKQRLADRDRELAQARSKQETLSEVVTKLKEQLEERRDTIGELQRSVGEKDRMRELLAVRIRERDQTLKRLDDELAQRAQRIETCEGHLQKRTGELEEFRTKATELTKQVEVTEAELRGTREIATRLEAELTESRHTTSENQHELHARIRDLETRLSEKAEEADVLRDLALDSERKAENLEGELFATKQLLGRLEAELDSWKSRNRQDASQSDQQVHELKKGLEERQAEVTRLRHQIEALQGDTSLVKEALASQRTKAETSIHHLEQVEAELAKMSAAYEKARHEADQYKRDSDHLRGQVETLKETHQNGSDQAARHAQQAEDLKKELIGAKSMADQAAFLKKHLEETQQALTRTSQEVTKTKSEYQAVSDELGHTEAALLSDRQTFRDKIALLEKSAEVSQAELAGARNIAARLEDELAVRDARLESIQTKLLAQVEKSATAKEELRSLHNRVQTLNDELRQVRSDNDALRARAAQGAERSSILATVIDERDRLRQALAERNDQVTEQESALAELSAGLKSALTQVETAEADQKHGKELIARLKEDNQNLDEEIGQTKAHVHELTNQLDGKVLEIDRLKSELDRLVASHVDKTSLQGLIERRGKEIAGLRQQIEQTHTDLTTKETAAKRHQGRIHDLERKIDDLNRGLADHAKQVEELTNRLSESERAQGTLEEELRRARRTIQHQEDTIADLEHRSEVAMARLAAAEAELAERDKRQEGFDVQQRNRQAEVAGLRRELSARQAEVEALRSSFDERLRQYQDTVAQEKNDHQAAVRKYESTIEQLEHSMSRQLETLQSEVDREHLHQAETASRLEAVTTTATTLEQKTLLYRIKIQKLEALQKSLESSQTENAETTKNQEKTRITDEAMAQTWQRVEAAETERLRLVSLLAETRANLDGALTRIERLSADASNQDVRLSSMRGTIDELRRSLEKRNREVEKARRVAEGFHTSLVETKDRLARVQQKHANTLSTVRSETERFEEAAHAAIRRMQMEIDVRADEMEEAVHLIEQREGQIWELTDEANRNAARVAASMTSMELCRARIAELESKLGQDTSSGPNAGDPDHRHQGNRTTSEVSNSADKDGSNDEQDTST